MKELPLILASASIIGIVVIGLIGESMDVGFTDIKDINSNSLDSTIHVRGVVKEFKKFSAGIRMLIEQEGYNIAVVYFTNEKTGQRGMCADVVGEVKTYEASLEIEAKELNLFIC
jgi:RecJ-like exonuclease